MTHLQELGKQRLMTQAAHLAGWLACAVIAARSVSSCSDGNPVLIRLYTMIDSRVYTGREDGNIARIRGLTATGPWVSLSLVNSCEVGTGMVTTG